jgi:sugar lactone lactonase YvrE
LTAKSGYLWLDGHSFAVVKIPVFGSYLFLWLRVAQERMTYAATLRSWYPYVPRSREKGFPSPPVFQQFFACSYPPHNPVEPSGSTHASEGENTMNPDAIKTNILTMRHSLGVAVCAGAVLLLTAGAQGQNLFVADFGSDNIYEFTPGGTRSTVASGLNYPQGLAFNSAGDLFEADEDNQIGGGNIYEFTPGGAKSTFASGLNPEGLAFNSAGDLFEADAVSGNIYEFTPGGTKSTFASGLNWPTELAFNSAGDLFESDTGSGNIYEFAPGGAKSTFASGLNPEGLAFNSAGDLFESDAGSGNIYEFTPGGAKSTFASGLSFPEGLAFNSAGDLFEADEGTGYEGGAYIYEFAPSGAQSTFASGLYVPTGLAFQSVTLPIPEPSALGLLAVGIGGLSALLVVRRRKAWGRMTLSPGFKFGSFVMLFRTTPNQRLIDKRLWKPVAMRLSP